MHAAAFFVALVCSLTFAVNGNPLNVDLINRALFYPHQHRPSPVVADLNPLTHARALASLERVNPTRTLTQATNDTCAWDTSAEQCFLSTGTVLDFLISVNNPLANYLERAIVCTLQLNELDCQNNYCIWDRVSCNVPHEEFRTFTSAPCLDEVRHIIDLQANALHCGGIDRRDRCEEVETCTWDPRVSYCFMDHWFYFHGIPMTDYVPEGYEEVYDARAAQLSEDIQTATENGDLVYASDLLDFEPSEFECPRNADQLVCDYVDARTPALLANAFCGVNYPEPNDQFGCTTDSNCQPTLDPTFPCQVADSILYAAFRAGDEIFAEAIEDPEASEYMKTTTDCAYTREEDECDGNCVWIDFVCVMSPRWAEEEAHRLIGDTNNRVCQFYRSDVETGCLDHKTVDDCTEDRQCVWLGGYNSCESGLYAWMDIALRESDEEESFRDAEATCFDISVEECGLPADEDDVDNEHTYLTAAIGSNMTVVGVVF